MQVGEQDKELFSGEMRHGSLLSLWGDICGWVGGEMERQKAQAFLWMPALFALGIGLYFSLPFEPGLTYSLAGLCVILFISSFLFFYFQSNFYRLFLIFFLGFVLRFVLAQIRSITVATPMIERVVGPVMVEGRIHSFERLEGEDDTRLLLSDLVVERLAAEDTPRMVRLRYRGELALQAGQRVRGLARLMPLSAPVVPGGFDFQRFFYFKGIGAVGFIYKDLEVLAEDESVWGFPVAAALVERVRRVYSERVYAVLDGREAAIVTALVIGEKSDIGEVDQEAMRASGLAHMLAISGLHVGLVCGVIFFFSRLMMVFCGDLALRRPVKKYAAFLALLGGVIYMVMAGATVPTQRAMLMSGVVLLAIMLDRDPFSLRLVAFAALVVLALAPESLLSPSFQMSFAAVTALIWFFEESRGFWMRANRKAGAVRKVFLYFAGVSVTTIVASAATAPFALYHFQQFANYSVVSNFLAMPVLAFLVMPMAVLSAVLMPLGLEEWPLRIMGAGVFLILKIAGGVSGLPGAVYHSAMIPFGAFVLTVLAGLWVVLVNGAFRWVALGLVFMASLAAWQARLPDILVSGEHRLSGFRDEEGTFWLSSMRREKFTAENWVQALGLEQDAVKVWGQNENLRCDDLGCFVDLRGVRIAFSEKAAGHREDCAAADIVIASDPVNAACAARVIDKFDTWRDGSHAVYIEDGGRPRIVSAAQGRGDRPWVNRR